MPVALSRRVTLATLADATAQEVFDQVARHLRKQGAKSLISRDTPSRLVPDACAYRGKGGMMCAAGCLIADDEYGEWMEFQTWDMLSRVGHVKKAHGGLIRALQAAHDMPDAALDAFRANLTNVANAFGLSPAVLDEAT